MIYKIKKSFLHQNGLIEKIVLSITLVFSLINLSNAQECFKEEVSNNFETAFGDVVDIEVADDFTVAAGESFVLEQFEFNLWIRQSATENVSIVNLRYYDNDDIFPGTLLASDFLTPTKDTVIGTTGFGGEIWNVHRITLALTDPVVFAGQADTSTTYWIGLLTPSFSSNAYYESSTASASQILSCFFLNGTWRNSFAGGTQFLGNASVFKAEGRCESLTSPSKEISLDFKIKIYPNPSNALVNVDVPSDIRIERMMMYDFLGKPIDINLVNGSLDISSFSEGTYLIQIVTDKGTVIKRILKQ